MSSLRAALAALALLGTVMVRGQSQALAASHPTFSVAPKKVKPTGALTISAAHLKAHATYLLLYEPSRKKKLKALLAAARTDGHGTYRSKIHLPAEGYCGPATIYLLGTRNVVASVRIAVECLVNGKAPPPPPSGH